MSARWCLVAAALAGCSTPVSNTPSKPDASVTEDVLDVSIVDVARDNAAPEVSVEASVDVVADVSVDRVAVDVAPDVTPSMGCASQPLCEGFEDAPVGGVPASPRWARVSPNCSGSGRLAVDGAVAHSGSRSLRVDGGGGYCDHVFLANESVITGLGPVVYGRVWVRFSDAFGDGHVTFLTMRDAADGSRDLRMGGQSRIFMWNRESDDATLPELSPVGISRSARSTMMRWHCVEFRVDQGMGALQTWLDGSAVEGLTLDATPTPDVDARWLSRASWRPRLIDLKLGWESYAGQTMTVWFDDVALGASRIGCD